MSIPVHLACCMLMALAGEFITQAPAASAWSRSRWGEQALRFRGDPETLDLRWKAVRAIVAHSHRRGKGRANPPMNKV